MDYESTALTNCAIGPGTTNYSVDSFISVVLYVKLSFMSSDFGDCGSAIDIMVARDSIIQDFV